MKNKEFTIPEMWGTRRRVSYGNTKTGGIPSINLLPGDKSADQYYGYLPATLKKQFGKCAGTCSGNCPGCYAMKMTRYPAVMITTAINTLEARENPERFFKLVEKELFSDGKNYKYIRIHDSGEFFNDEYFTACMEFIKRHPGTRFGAYTKENGIVNAYGIDNLPENLSLSCSPWPGFCDPIGNLPQFCYDDGSNPELSNLKHCPAVDRNGKRTGVQCRNCLHCYNAKRGDRWAVYAH